MLLWGLLSLQRQFKVIEHLSDSDRYYIHNQIPVAWGEEAAEELCLPKIIPAFWDTAFLFTFQLACWMQDDCSSSFPIFHYVPKLFPQCRKEFYYKIVNYFPFLLHLCSCNWYASFWKTGLFYYPTFTSLLIDLPYSFQEHWIFNKAKKN